MPILNPKQNEYIRNANARWNIKSGAVRSGKSYCDIAYVIPQRLRAVKDEAGLNVILGVSKETIETNVLQPMREIYTGAIVGTINSRNVAMICGLPVYCLGAEKASQVSKLQGKSVKYCYGDEIAKWNQNVFNMLKSRLDKPYSKFDGSCNPEYPSHWLKQFIDRDDLDIYCQKYTIFDNPALDPDVVKNLCKEYDGTVFYQRYILGEWTLAEGLVYPMHKKAICKPPESAPERYVLSIDYGTLNAFAALLWAKIGKVWYCIKEYYYSGRETSVQKTDDEYGKDIDSLFGQYTNEYIKLPVIIDPSAASFITLMLRKKKYKVIQADNNVLDGIRETATAMQLDLIKISPECKNFIRELEGYVWDEDASEDRPVKVNDHCLTGDTLVMTEAGEKPISELVGTSGNVWSFNTETGKPELKPYHDCKMTRRKAEAFCITTETGKEIWCTSDHLVLTDIGWIKASASVYRKIMCIDGTTEEITDYKSLGNYDVYNMEVDDNHNFAINGGLIVHNCVDSARYFVKTMHIAENRKKIQARWD